MLSQNRASGGPDIRDVELEQPAATFLFQGLLAPAQLIQKAVRPFRVDLSPTAQGVRVCGEELPVLLALEILDHVSGAVRGGGSDVPEVLSERTVMAIVANHLRHHQVYHLQGLPHPLRPMTLGQVAFMESLLGSERDLVFGVGPTGTGKTHLAIAAGLHLVHEGRFKTLVITRPRILLEGETMTPALRSETVYDEQMAPVEDVLLDLLGHDEMRRRIEHGLVEITPLGRMRGRTFNGSFVVVDDAQNMSVRKMRIALTRMGRNAKMVVTGDPDQSDLPEGEPSGLGHILPLIIEADLAHVHRFDRQEIVRNELVARIEALYERSTDIFLRDAA